MTPFWGPRLLQTLRIRELIVGVSSIFPVGAVTPGISFGGASTGVTYATQFGTRIYLGGFVFVIGGYTLSAKGSSTGAARITGLPVAVRNNADSVGAVTLRFVNVTYTGLVQGYTAMNSTTINLEDMTEAGTVASLDDTNFANNSEVLFTAIYRAT